MENQLPLVKTVKSISTKTYELLLVEALLGGYYIIDGVGERVQQSVKINDYNVASFLFDIRMKELEEH